MADEKNNVCSRMCSGKKCSRVLKGHCIEFGVV